MAAVSLSPSDLTPFAPNLDEVKAQAMIDDAIALAARVAPCILDEDFPHGAAAKAVLRGAILRWIQSSETGPTLTAGPYQLRQDGGDSDAVKLAQLRARRSLFWPSEINDLQDLCRSSSPDAVSVTQIGL